MIAAATLLLLATVPAPDAAAMMEQVAENFAKAVDARREYVHKQLVKSSLVRSNGQISRKETRQYAVVPEQSKTIKKLVTFTGEYRDGGQMHPLLYTGLQRQGPRHRCRPPGQLNGTARGDEELA